MPKRSLVNLGTTGKPAGISPDQKGERHDSKEKGQPKAAARSAKPRIAHKSKISGGRKMTRKSPAKHSAKAKTPSHAGGDYMQFSGKFTVRLPKSLHQALVDRAEREGVSLNLFVTNALSRTVAVAGGKKR